MHTQGQFTDFVEKLFGQSTPSNQGLNISVVCPYCKLKKQSEQFVKRKFIIRSDNEKCHCWSCGIKGKNLLSTIKKFKPEFLSEYYNFFSDDDLLQQILYEDESESIAEETVSLPKGFSFLAAIELDADCYPATEARKYLLQNRNLTPKDLWRFKFGIIKQKTINSNFWGRIIIPSHDINGDLNFYTARSFKTGVRPKYLNSPVKREKIIFNEINIDWSKELTLVEGPFDMFSCGENSTCLLGKELTENYILFTRIIQNKTPILLALDADAELSAINIAKLLIDYGIPVRFFKLPVGFKDPGELKRSEFQTIAKNANLFTDMDFLKSKIAMIGRRNV